MKYLFVIALLIVGCKIEPSPVEVTVKSDAKPAVVLEFESQTMFLVGSTNFFNSSYSISNNSGKILDSVKVTFTGIISTTSVFTFKNVQVNEKSFVSVTHNASSQVKTVLLWW
jgi:hypothetical protein